MEPGTFSGPAVIDAAAKQEEALYQRVVQIVCAVAILLTALVLVFAFRKDRRQFEESYVDLSQIVHMEIEEEEV